MGKIINIFTFIVTLICILVGILVIVNTSHELTHYYDLKDNVTVTEICVLNIALDGSNMIGFVEHQGSFEINHEYLENRAIIPTIIMFIFLSVCVSHTILNVRDRREVE